MKLIRNAGNERVIDHVRPALRSGGRLDLASSAFSLFAFAELEWELSMSNGTRLVLPNEGADLAFLGSAADRAARNRLQAHWLARRCAEWVAGGVEVRRAGGPIPQGALVVRDGEGRPQRGVLGAFALSTDGLGLTPGNPLSLIQGSETPQESELLSGWFDAQWAALPANSEAKLAWSKLWSRWLRTGTHTRSTPSSCTTSSEIEKTRWTRSGS